MPQGRTGTNDAKAIFSPLNGYEEVEDHVTQWMETHEEKPLPPKAENFWCLSSARFEPQVHAG
jgi:hypothetical protein